MPVFENLVKTIPDLTDIGKTSAPAFDWALHPGGSTVITGVEQALNLTPAHLRASYEVYIQHGNSSSATIFSVLRRLLDMGNGNEHIVSCAFGPGIAIEMMILKRSKSAESSGSSTPDHLVEGI